MAEEICVKVYQYDELETAAKEKARNWFREGDKFFHDFVFEDAKTVAALMGIVIEEIHFTGFWSQGDGAWACFEGHYAYEKGSVKAVKAHAPEDTDLHRIAEALADLQRRNFYGLEAMVKHQGRYYHEYCTVIDVEDHRDPNGTANHEAEEALAELLRAFMKWIYRQLEQEYEYQQSDECVAENIRANSYEFYEDGRRAWFPADSITCRRAA